VIVERDLIKLKISDLIFDKTNPNQMTQDQMKGLRKSMQRFGYLTPIVVDKDNKIADGEHRALIYKELGMQEIPAYRVHFDNDTERRLLRQTMNKLKGTHDLSLDADEMAMIYEQDKFSDLAELIAQDTKRMKEMMLKFKPGLPLGHEDDAEIDKIIDEQLSKNSPDTQLGDVYQLGDHRLICADCTDKRSIDKLLDGTKIDMIFTDPPYDMESQALIAAFDSSQELAEFQLWMLGDKQAVALCSHTENFVRFYVHDFIMPTMINNKSPLYEHNLIAQFGTRDSRNLYDGFSTIVRVNTLRLAAEHKEFRMGKRPELPALFFSHFADGPILDIFAGSGSTMIAAQKAGFVCYMVEQDPHYCDIIKKRYESYTGDKAKLIPNG
jgi:16S rRNA G966 N2-methylase RsmD